MVKSACGLAVGYAVVNALLVLDLCSVAAAETCRSLGDDGDGDVSALLQTAIQTAPLKPPQVQPSHLLRSNSSGKTCLQSYPVGLLQLDNQQVAHFLGYEHRYVACTGTENETLPQLLQVGSVLQSVRVPWGPPLVPPSTLVFSYLTWCFVLIGVIFHSILTLYNTPKGSAARYPEAEAWKRSIVDWLWMGWATQWIARWGTAENSALTKINAAEIPLSDPEDECDVCFKKFQQLWKEEVERVGLANAALLKVVTRFVTYRKVFAIGAWNACYEGFLFMGPPLAIKWVTQYMNWLYTQRGLGEEITQEQLVGPSLLLILIFTGLPLLMAVSNSMCTMLNGRISIRIDGALSLAVYDKAQRLPVVQDDDSSFSLTKAKKRGRQDDSDAASAAPLREDAEFEATEADAAERMLANGGVPKRFNLVQVVTNDINTNLMTIPNSIARMVVMIPVLCGTLTLLIGEIGWAFIFSLAMAFANLALMTAVGFMMRNSLGLFYTTSGKRLQFMQEVMAGIRFIKGCGAEGIVQQRLESARQLEIRSLDTFYTIQCFMFVLSLQFPKLYLLASLAGYAIFHNGNVEPTVIMSLIPLLLSVQGAISVVFSLIPTLVMALPSCRRLESFLKLPEAPRALPMHRRSEEVDPPPWVTVVPRWDGGSGSPPVYRLQGDFSWLKSQPSVLRNMDVAIPQGKCVAVLGHVGCGKTTFLHAILGELVQHGDSRISVPSSIAYSSQTPHLFEGSLKENILKGGALSPARYKEAIYMACLLNDLEILPGGDEVPVGGRGISLSGGQKARVSLARAAYDTSDLVLLDDPFAAVDAHTSQHLHECYLHGPLMKGRTRVVCCQPDAERIARFDWVIVLQGGEIKVQGPALDVMRTEAYVRLLSSQQFSDQCIDGEAEEALRPKARQVVPEEVFELREEECEGRASWATIAYFGRMGGWVAITTCILFYLVKNVLDMRTQVQLSIWMSHGSAYNAGLISLPPNPWIYILHYILWTAASTVAWFICWVGGQSWTLSISQGCHRAMIKSLLHAPIDRFYDKTPTGRIMNRMANDMMNVDMQVFIGCCSTIGMVWSLSVPLYYVHLQMPLWFTLVTVPFYYLIFLLISLYWKTMVPLRYLMQVSKSGVSSEVADVENTPATVRAYGMEEMRLRSFTLAVRQMISADFLGRIVCIRWLCNRLFVLGGCFVTGLAIMCVWLPGALDVGSASLVINTMFSLIVSIEGSLATGSMAQYQIIAMNRIYEYTSLPEEREDVLPTDGTFRNLTVTVPRAKLCELDLQIAANGVVQVIQVNKQMEILLNQIPHTAAFLAATGKMLADLAPWNEALRHADAWHRIVAVNGAHRTAADIAEELCHGDSEEVMLHIQSGWLADGVKVEIKSLRVGYADVPQDVLHGISLTIPRRSKAGVVGPTGCGKSTLLLCILRMLEPRDGRIYLEGVDTQNLGLHTLRQAIGLVPQDPVLLQGSLRFNVDPFELYDDSRIWEALKLVHLDDFVRRELKGGLDFQVTGEGANLSFGQRQLISLARNIVRKPMLLLLDEATSAIDPRTQELLQHTIDKAFPDSTMIVIAHRLETILNFDMAVVMDRGRVAEKGSITDLSKVKGGRFAKMLAAKGLSV